MTGEERSDARAYLEAMFEKGDTVALLAVPRWTSTGVIQQIKVVEELVRPESVK